MDQLWIDLRQAMKRIIRRPGTAFLAILLLAAGLGATTAMFSAVHAVVLKPLDFNDSESLFMLWQRNEDGSSAPVGFETIADVREKATLIDGIAGIGAWQPVLSGGTEPERLEGLRVSGNFFSLLGVTPQVGRSFSMDDDSPEAERVVMLGHGLWVRRFGSDRDIAGRTILLNDTPHMIVGVLPESFEPVFSTNFGPPAEIWRPLRYTREQPWACRTCQHLRALIRVRPDVPIETAASELDTISEALVAAYPDEYSAPGFVIEPLLENAVGPVRPVLTTLLGAVVLLLGLFCVNLASLQLGSLTGRMDELLVRAAVGASRSRIIRQHLAESFVLSVIGGTLGIALALAGTRLFERLTTTRIPRLDEAAGFPSLVVLGFAIVAMVSTTLVIGIVPALRASRIAGQLHGGRALGDPSRRRLQGLLVAIEVALAVALLIGAGLLARTLDSLFAVDPGFEPANLITAEVASIGDRYDDITSEAGYFERIAERLRALPGVEDASAVSQLPMGGNRDRYGIRALDRPLSNPSDAPYADRFAVTSHWFSTMETRLLRGREITSSDTADSEPVALISEPLAEYYWPGEDALGKKVQMGDDDSPWRTVVGIAESVSHDSLSGDPRRQIYVPKSQWSWSEGGMVLAIRTAKDPRTIETELKQLVHEIDPSQPVSNVATMDKLLRGSVERQQFVSRVLRAFGSLALVLVSLGVFAVLSLAIGQRRREIAVRVAVGARVPHIVRAVAGVGLGPVLFGILAGIVLAGLLGRFLESLLFGVSSSDPVTASAVTGIVLGATVAASIPAIRRAVKIDPAQELRV